MRGLFLAALALLVAGSLYPQSSKSSKKEQDRKSSSSKRDLKYEEETPKTNTRSAGQGGLPRVKAQLEPEKTRVQIPDEYPLRVRLDNTLNTSKTLSGETFTATLIEDIVIDDVVVARKGAKVTGAVIESTRGGRVQNVAELLLQVRSLTAADGQVIPARSLFYRFRARQTLGKDAAIVAGTGGAGAAVGAAAGGGSGAAAGAAIGAATGVVIVLMTHGEKVELPVETPLEFRLMGPAEWETTPPEK